LEGKKFEKGAKLKTKNLHFFLSTLKSNLSSRIIGFEISIQ
jgi:hypothetical protein